MALRPGRSAFFPIRANADGTESLSVRLADGSEANLSLAALSAALLGSSILTTIPTPPTTARTYQRDTFTGGAFNKGAGAVPIVVSVSQAAATAEYRLRDYAAPGTTLVDWVALGSGLTAGSNSFNVNIPAGPKRYILDVRANGYTPNMASTTQPFGVGEVTMAFGQSLCSTMFTLAGTQAGVNNAAAGITPSTTGTVYNNNGGSAPGWLLANDSTAYVSTFVSTFINAMEAAEGVVCSLSGYSQGATAISGFGSGNAAMVSTIGQVQKWRTTIWNQGHSDGNNTQAAYLTSLNSLMTYIDGQNAFGGTKIKVLQPPPNINASWGPNIYQVRAAMAQYVAANPSTSVLDIAPDIQLAASSVDGIGGTHPSNSATGAARFGFHTARAVKGLRGLDTNGDKGPVVTAVSRASGSQTFVFTVAHAGGTDLVKLGASAHLQFQFYPVGTIATTLTPPIAGSLTPTSAARIDATHFSVTVSDTLTDSQSFDYYYGWPYVPVDGSLHGFFDNNTADGGAIGRALTVNTAAINCAAPAGAVAPGVPTVAVGSATASSLVVTLSDSSGGTPTSYAVQRSTASDFSANLVTLNSGSIAYTGTSTTYTDTGLAASTPYWYRATATNGAGTSSQSTGVSGSTSSQSITVSSVSPLVAGSSGTVSGTYTGSAPTGLNYAIDGGGSTAASSPTISGGTWSFAITDPTAGAHSIVVTGTGANTSTSNTFNFTTTAPASFLLDSITTTTVGAYSLRKLRAAFAGSAIRVKRSSDNTQQDIGFDGSGNLDTAALATFVGSGTGTVVTWYDQSTAGKNLVTGLNPNPNITVSGTLQTFNNVTAKPSINFPTSSVLQSAVGFGISGNTYAAFGVAGETSTTTNAGRIVAYTSNAAGAIAAQNDVLAGSAILAYYSNTSHVITTYSGGAGSTVAKTLPYASQFASVYTGTQSIVTVDGTAGTAVANTASLTSGGVLSVGTSPNNTVDNQESFNGPIAEVIVTQGTLAAGDQATIRTSQQTYYGTP